jgi:hypothetical protein
MLRVSFRSVPSASFPRLRRGKPALVGLAAAVIVLAGCGSGGDKSSASDLRTVGGGDYRFSAPSSWTIRRSGRQVTATSGSVDLVGVTIFTLARPYRPRLWAKAVPALDRTATALAAELGGKLRERESVVLAGRRARRYDIDYRRDGKALVERTAFVLSGRREHQLLCRFASGGDDGPCRTLFSSFRLG